MEEKSYKELLASVKTFTFDVDGVFTNNSVLLYPNSEPVRVMNVKDGYAVQLAIKKGYRIAIITGGRSEEVRRRFQNLGVTDIYLGAERKIACFDEFIHTYDIDPATVLHMADDLPDFEVMQKVMLPTCPADATDEIKAISRYISDKKGGEGCVRDIIEQVLRVQDSWYDADNHDATKEALNW